MLKNIIGALQEFVKIEAGQIFESPVYDNGEATNGYLRAMMKYDPADKVPNYDQNSLTIDFYTSEDGENFSAAGSVSMRQDNTHKGVKVETIGRYVKISITNNDQVSAVMVHVYYEAEEA